MVELMVESRYWLTYKIIVFYCFLASARACFTLGDNPYIDLALSMISIMLIPPTFYQITFRKLWAVFFLALAAIYTMRGGTMAGYAAQFIMVFIPIQLICLGRDFQVDIFKSLSKWYAVLLVASMIWWCLWLLGIPLPHISEKMSWQYNDFGFVHQNYFLFRHTVNLSPYVTSEFLKRFNGFFLEPGHIGTITSLFLFANGFDFKKKINIVYLTVIVISFSAAAYVLTLIGYFLYRFSDRRSKIVLLVVLVIVGSILVIQYNGGNNIINEYIFGKLTRQRGAIEGRFSAQTQHLWEQAIANGDIWLGMGAGAKTPQSAGYKVYLIMNGMLGGFLAVMAYWYIQRSNSTKLGFYMFLLLLISFLQRVYCFWDAFLDPYILGVAYMSIKKQR